MGVNENWNALIEWRWHEFLQNQVDHRFLQSLSVQEEVQQA